MITIEKIVKNSEKILSKFFKSENLLKLQGKQILCKTDLRRSLDKSIKFLINFFEGNLLKFDKT